MKKRHSGRKFSLNERVSNTKLNVEKPTSPPPSPANQPKAQETQAPDSAVTEDLERVKEILSELPISTNNEIKEENKVEKSPQQEGNLFEEGNLKDIQEAEPKAEDEQTDGGTESSRSERPVDIPTALRSPNKNQQPKQSVGTRVAFIEPVRSVKKDRRRTQKISFENMKEVELKKSAFLDVSFFSV
jgi:hypothetical protein